MRREGIGTGASQKTCRSGFYVSPFRGLGGGMRMCVYWMEICGLFRCPAFGSEDAAGMRLFEKSRRVFPVAGYGGCVRAENRRRIFGESGAGVYLGTIFCFAAAGREAAGRERNDSMNQTEVL